MSTCYYVCDPARKNHLDYLYDNWDKFQVQVKRAFSKYCALAPAYEGAEEIKENINESLTLVVRSGVMVPESLEDDHEIGVSTGRSFKWADQNGFHCLKDLERYLQEHPKERMYSEYGEEISLEDFKKRENMQ